MKELLKQEITNKLSSLIGKSEDELFTLYQLDKNTK